MKGGGDELSEEKMDTWKESKKWRNERWTNKRGRGGIMVRMGSKEVEEGH